MRGWRGGHRSIDCSMLLDVTSNVTIRYGSTCSTLLPKRRLEHLCLLSFMYPAPGFGERSASRLSVLYWRLLLNCGVILWVQRDN
jgi:hypothetical protein